MLASSTSVLKMGTVLMFNDRGNYEIVHLTSLSVLKQEKFLHFFLFRINILK